MNIEPLSIQFDLRRRGVTQAALARSLAVREAIVSKVIAGKERSERIEKEIERIIGWCPWNGLPVTRRRRKDGEGTEQH